MEQQSLHRKKESGVWIFFVQRCVRCDILQHEFTAFVHQPGRIAMKVIPVQEAMGKVLCHDVTQIIPGQFKGPAFRKGHILKADDIPQLLRMGKEHIYVWEMDGGLVHEDEAALRIARAVGGPGLCIGDPREGKVELAARHDGLLKVDFEALLHINMLEEVILSTLHTNQRVRAGKVVGGTRIIPLVIEENKIRRIEEVSGAHSPLLEVRPFTPMRVGIVTTGNEVYFGRIKDRFGPVVTRKLEELGCSVMGQRFVSDRVDMIVDAVKSFLDAGAEMITITGGMSVDPDDVTPAGIRACGGKVVTYGAPVLPGAMFMLAYLGTVPVMGLPGCVMYHGSSIFDLVLPRILAGESLTRMDILRLAHGGLCVQCPECRYPDCGFGKAF